MKRKKTWIVIADGARARILLNEGRGRGVVSVAGGEWLADHAPDRELNSDRPGRTFDSVGAGRHAMEPTSSPHQRHKAEFARMLVDHLMTQRANRAFDQLVIVAAPATLGEIRTHLNKDLEACLLGEIDKDLTHIRDNELGPHLAEIVDV